MSKQGWFTMKGREGDRTLEQQLVGLEKLVEEVGGKTVLDVGCAEGLISLKLSDAGAQRVVGLEIVSGHLDVARRLGKPGKTDFVLGDANTFTPKPSSYDVVLLLAILHKLKDPEAATRRFAAAARSLVVVRLPPSGPVIVDPRSNNQPRDIAAVLASAGFHLESTSRGSFDEWIGYYRRGPALNVPSEWPAVQVEPPVMATVAPTPAPAPAPAPTPAPAPSPAPAPAPTPAPAQAPAPAEQAKAEELAKARSEVGAPRPPGDATVDKPEDFIAHREPKAVNMTMAPEATPVPATPRRRFARPAQPPKSDKPDPEAI